MKKNILTLLTLNVEYDKHVDAIEKMLRLHRPDVFCFQEVPKEYAESFANVLGYKWRYVSMATLVPRDRAVQIEMGVMIAWNPFFDICDESQNIYSYGDQRSLLLTNDFPNASKRILLLVKLQFENTKLLIGTTHFTWTQDGLPTASQRNDMEKLLGVLSEYRDDGGIIFCGDFNAPRGGEIFSILSSAYTDNLPEEIITTLDPTLHRMAPLSLVVDGIFSTKEYHVDEVRVIDGVSDHVALFAQVSHSVC